MDFMANSTIVGPGLTMERNQPAVCLLWEGSEFMVDSTVVVLALTREESPSACVWFVACVKVPSLERYFLVSSMIVDPGLAMERIHQHVFWSFGRGVNSMSTNRGGSTSGLTRKERESNSVCFSFGRGVNSMSTNRGGSTSGLTRKERESNSVCFVCCLCEGPKFWEGFYGQLDNGGPGTDHGGNPPERSHLWVHDGKCLQTQTYRCQHMVWSPCLLHVRLCPCSCKTYLSYPFFLLSLSADIIYERKT